LFLILVLNRIQKSKLMLPSYGVVIGRYDHFEKENPAEVGNWYHGYIYLNAPSYEGGAVTQYQCAVDVNEIAGTILYFAPTNLDRTKFAGIDTWNDGYYDLAPNATSGAIDYIRNPLVSVPLGCLAIFLALFSSGSGNNQPWVVDEGNQTLDVLENFITGCDKIYVFGAKYTYNGIGIHQTHMNQGDPIPDPSSPDYSQQQTFWADAGIWQDGAIIIEKAGTLQGFFIRFATQSMNTNDQGHPA
jgi:hypothetical protein